MNRMILEQISLHSKAICNYLHVSPTMFIVHLFAALAKLPELSQLYSLVESHKISHIFHKSEPTEI